ncbi:YeaC family protein [Aestuariirhabdus litorea]|uniref:DUF1315 family protein n=1 Tax=Aestuariirhabdus litorea TaxID=2528527 RepID=A0A3P3VPT8_9GAMM|nr:DUF1315 family protein [Aestuariirhabdus litorea]RRJ84630.1 DUF1315 family protein [Aestuariirhabdus litorea]RWW97855.1 DUF1315 family protein [Endozoicomonadaceae bacterium GTF-13]
MSFEGMSFKELLANITPEIYRNLRSAVELGKWPDGRRLTPEQRQHCMQAMIAWEQLNLPEEERSGYMEQQCKSQSGQNDAAEIQALNLTRH